MSVLLPVKAGENEVVAVSLPCGGSVVIEQTRGSAAGRPRVAVTITLPEHVDLALKVNGEMLLLGDE